MAKPAARIAFLQVTLALAGVAVLAQSFRLQVVQHAHWKRRAEELRSRESTVPASRGVIFDRNGKPLAITVVKYHLGVAPDQVRDTAKLVEQVARLVGQDKSVIAARIAKGKWFYYHGPFTAEQMLPLIGLKGVHPQRLYVRAFPEYPLAGPLLGGLDSVGRGRGGIERAFDSLLAGVDGLKIFDVDGKGRAVEGPNALVTRAIPGHDVYLTIDSDLQSIVEQALDGAIRDYRAADGDIVILDVHSGEIFAAASVRTDASGVAVPTASAFVESYEPGSTAKIFTAAAVLSAGVENPSVSGMGGVWQFDAGGKGLRTIEDVHRVDGMLSLADAIKHSSNIAMSQFAHRLSAQEHFTVLRDFGFGVATAVGLRAEDRGYLRLPSEWENRLDSEASLAQGYEFRTSAIQMAAAYAVIANGGRLITPTLLREVHAGDSNVVLWRHEPQVVRRVISPELSAQLIGFLKLATDSTGTGGMAQLDRASVIGKTGTAKLIVNGDYVNEYRASFAGLYPGDRPQVVLYVMVNRPKVGSFYGGLVAAPVVRSILQQAIAIHTTPIDRRDFMATVVPVAAAVRRPRAPATSRHLVTIPQRPARRAVTPSSTSKIARMDSTR